MPIRLIENTFIPLADGTRLAARLWLPADAEAHPVPALFEFLPYRKNDGTVFRDALRQPYFAAHGYAAVRVDMRGSGDADGILLDEYLQQEQDDALEVIAWLAAQPWCNGNVGMHGISWGGFNSLQVAARRPPALRAILVIGFTDDRYRDDVHYMGGCVLASQMLQWATVMFYSNAAPPDPRFVGDRWREMWLARMEQTPPYLETWLAHQRRDAYWKHGSVSEDYAAIQIPVLAVGGWTDSYNNSLPRLLAGLRAPRRGLIGPWAHAFPELGPPSPVIGFLQESVRWWDHWLKGRDTGLLAEPFLRSYILQSQPPTRHHTFLTGYWVADPAWPSPFIRTREFFLNDEGGAPTLGDSPAPEKTLAFRGLQTHGFDLIPWASYGTPGSYPADQRAADGESLAFTSAPLTERLVILGNPELKLEIASDQPLALVCARLCDVAPDGTSRLVSWGLLNLTRRDSLEEPTPLEPGKSYAVTVQLNLAGYDFPKDHQIRISISPTNARHAWPSPRPVTLTVFTGAGCRLRLPIRTPQPDDGTLTFPPPESAPPIQAKWLRTASRQQTLTRDQITDTLALTIEQDAGRFRLADGLEVDEWTHETHSIREGDPLSLTQTVRARLAYRRGAWGVRIETESRLAADVTHFYVTNEMLAFEGEMQVFTKSWSAKIERDLL